MDIDLESCIDIEWDIDSDSSAFGLLLRKAIDDEVFVFEEELYESLSDSSIFSFGCGLRIGDRGFCLYRAWDRLIDNLLFVGKNFSEIKLVNVKCIETIFNFHRKSF
ncbi:hypothetical protein TRFO_18683 [Tritrichomonas foetus]|uniref:Uncharacterized protein n=1 Tax=Tritrichomonas foetus TaxID=1144522 RepID=A0A1J4KKN1_9EUKA|nr:hypothetical protein TRFO_18683 [Tritrichomonas foetus]|eukprot:OHT11787.1 hypothetical protein TRFO_18683 [Tritrichomonas foetus]